MLIAVLLATLIHVSLMNLEFDLKPAFAPSVSLPRSVSVFLGQRKAVDKPLMQTEKIQNTEPVPQELPAAETKLEKPVLQEISAVKEKPISQLPQPALPQKTVRQPVVKKIMHASLGPESIKKESVSEPDEATKVEKSAASAEPQAVEGNKGVTLPGTLQMAYPRYQPNDPPSYPGLARKRGQEGTVILQVLVNSEGRVNALEIETSSGFGQLDRAALSAVRKWSFEPGRLGKERVAMWVRVPVTFKLKK